MRDDRGRVVVARRRERPAWQWWMLAGLIAAVAPAVLIFAAIFVSMLSAPDFGILLVIGAAASVPLVLVAAKVRWEERPRGRRDVPIRAKRCDACGYAIDRLPVEDDGCRVCPECGAAWRVPGCAALPVGDGAGGA